ncbi:hypothetical protein PR048_028913 [Dryococelus australis]|uniref:Uncharacterized protein n=1 Tax=Dryococelus australis TaxID=614101 RepID=A0ABQ9GBW0_9NEOP|nr:hypothetical protein PR048_028913 [Dryococelus australis]
MKTKVNSEPALTPKYNPREPGILIEIEARLELPLELTNIDTILADGNFLLAEEVVYDQRSDALFIPASLEEGCDSDSLTCSDPELMLNSKDLQIEEETSQTIPCNEVRVKRKRKADPDSWKRNVMLRSTIEGSCVSNSTIYDCHKPEEGDGFCYIWDETNNTGSTEIGTCLLDYISIYLTNRNQYTSAVVVYAVNKDFWEIGLDQKGRNKIPISKKNDLLYLLRKGVIPSEYTHCIEDIAAAAKSREIVPWATSDESN